MAGETGSGKTTQLPKICLELGRGVRGLDRPHPAAPDRRPHRRRADRRGAGGRRSGDAVGYPVRFTDQVGPATLVKVMTDGILLAEIQRDRDAAALRHDHHRRGPRAQPQHRLPARLPQAAAAPPARPQADHHLGHHRPRAVRRALRRRAGASRSPAGPTRSRCATARWSTRPTTTPARPSERDQIQAISTRSTSCASRGRATSWCSSPASARSATPPTRCDGTCVVRRADRGAAAVRAAVRGRAAQGVRRTRGRRIVLATNVAETSLTVPGIRYVVDPGTARISRYSHRTKVQRLPIEPISQASANQRAGRCGRVADGICIRLYSEDDFAGPAGVHRAGDPAHQPGLGDPADGRAGPRRRSRRSRSSSRRTAARSSDGVALLEELGALDPAQTDAASA